MKIKNIKDVEDFLATVDKCSGDVILTSVYGETNLISSLSLRSTLLLQSCLENMVKS